MTLNHLTVRLHPWNFGDAEYSFIAIALWPGVEAPDKVLSMCQVEQTVCKRMTDVKLWLLYKNTWNHLTVWKKSPDLFKNVIYKMCS